MGTLNVYLVSVLLLCIWLCPVKMAAPPAAKTRALKDLARKLTDLKQRLLRECPGHVEKFTELHFTPQFGRRRDVVNHDVSLEFKLISNVVDDLNKQYEKCKADASTTIFASTPRRRTTTSTPTIPTLPAHLRPLGVWPLNSASGLQDISGNGNHGGAFSVSYATGPDFTNGGALYLSGDDSSFVRIPKRNTSLFIRDGSLTIIFQLLPTGLRDWEIPLAFMGNHSLNEHGLMYWLRSDYMEIDDKALAIGGAFNTDVRLWYNIVIRYDHTKNHYWVRAGRTRDALSTVISSTEAGKGVHTDYDLYLGRSKLAYTGMYSNYQGRMSCLQIYGDALTDDDVKLALSAC